MKWLKIVAILTFTPLSVEAETLFVDSKTTIYKYENGVQSTFATGFSNLGFMTFDSSGDLFAVSTGSVIEFSNNGGTLSSTPTTIITGLQYPTLSTGSFSDGLAFDAAGNLYVSDSGEYNTNTVSGSYVHTQTAKVYQYKYNSATKTFNGSTISSSNVWVGTANSPTGQLVFYNGSLYLPNWTNEGVQQMTVRSPTDSLPGPSFNAVAYGTGTPATLDAEGLAFDASGNMYISIYFGQGIGEILKYTSSGTKTVFASGSSTFDWTKSLGFDSNGNLFATANNSILEFVNIDGTLSSTPIITPLTGASALVFQPQVVPEPSTWMLLASGMLSVFFRRRFPVKAR